MALAAHRLTILGEPWFASLDSLGRYFWRSRLSSVSRYGFAMSETHYSDEHTRPACLKCDSPMRLTNVESEYPGYLWRTFECQACGGAMTEWILRISGPPELFSRRTTLRPPTRRI